MQITSTQKIDIILAAITRWASRRGDILALALVGSWARGAARADSDVDLVLLAPNPAAFRRDSGWLGEIDWAGAGCRVDGWRDAEYGAVWSRHVCLAAGLEIEFGFGTPAWASIEPVDAGTFRVVRDGCCILFDPTCLLDRLVKHVASTADRLKP